MASDTDPGNELPLGERELQLDPNHLQLGHYVSRLDRSWIGTPFSLAGVLVRRPSEINWFRRNCSWVVIDLVRSRNLETSEWHDRKPNDQRASRPAWAADAGNPSASINLLRRATIDAEAIEESFDSHALISRQVDSLIEAVGAGRPIDTHRAREGVRQIASRLEKNLAAMVWLTRIKDADRYTAEHCVNVAILGMGLAQALGWDGRRVERAGLAGLLHDLGKTRLDLEILNKPGRLTPEEYEHVKLHTRYGYELLENEQDIHPDVARAVLEHHERPDGLGYPMGRVQGAVQPLSALISVVDAYDAITSRRPYSRARSHHDALGILWKERGRQFSSEMVEALIQFLGWITPGTLVRLSSDQYAVVVHSSHEHRLWPRVRVLEPDGDRYVAGARMDLNEHNKAHPDGPIRIAEVLPTDALNVDLREVLDGERL